MKHYASSVPAGLAYGWLLVLLFSVPAWSNVYEIDYPALQFEAVGTGNAAGHVLTVEITNTSIEPVEFQMGQFLVPGNGENKQSIVIL